MKRDLYEIVSARIVAELERGAAPWIKPWSATAGQNTPCNAVSNRPYSGCNVVLLWMAQQTEPAPSTLGQRIEAAAKAANIQQFIVDLPDGFGIDSFFSSPGWKRTVQSTGSGENTVINNVTWSGGKVPTEEDAAFSFLGSPSSNKTYTFQVRQGIRYSDGSMLRASDFRRSFERLFAIGAPAIDDYKAIVGAGACIRRRIACDLTRGVVVNDRSRAVVFHL